MLRSLITQRLIAICMQDVSTLSFRFVHQSQELFEVTFNEKFDGLADEQKAILKYASEAEIQTLLA